MDTWSEIEQRLRQIHTLPHNLVWQRERGCTTDGVVAHTLASLRSGLVGTPQREDFRGPRVFLRVAGPGNAAYAGEWWFDAAVLEALDAAYGRILFDRASLDATIRTLLREALAIRHDWNPIDEIWSLALPAGESLVGYTGVGTRQPRWRQGAGDASGWLAGGIRQVWFPVKNPLWVRLHRRLG